MVSSPRYTCPAMPQQQRAKASSSVCLCPNPHCRHMKVWWADHTTAKCRWVHSSSLAITPLGGRSTWTLQGSGLTHDISPRPALLEASAITGDLGSRTIKMTNPQQIKLADREQRHPPRSPCNPSRPTPLLAPRLAPWLTGQWLCMTGRERQCISGLVLRS